MLEQQVVHLPERLIPRVRRNTLCRFRRVKSLGMCLGEREVAEDKSQAITETLLECGDAVMRARAVRALEVTVLHERDWCVGGTGDVIHFAHLGLERAANVFTACIVSSASRMPSAPGFTPMGDL